LKRVTVTNEADFRNITIKFTDATALPFDLCVSLDIDPELVDWKTGDGLPRKTDSREWFGDHSHGVNLQSSLSKLIGLHLRPASR
jgi:hypothetical protein